VKELRVLSSWALARRTVWHAAFRVLLLGALVLLGSALPSAALALPVKGEVAINVENGFARLVFTFADDVEPETKIANNIIMITFKRPVDVMVDKLDVNSGGYISVTRRDPDGKAIRIALARRATMNSMSVAEKLFIDLLPDTWTGLPPGLPKEVIEDLAKRAREAEKKQRQQRALSQQTTMPSIRVRVASQPTFTRYVFDLPELTAVAANSTKDKLTLTFDAVLKFDLADAQAMRPPVVSGIESGLDREAVVVQFTFAGKVDVRTFREGLSYIVDVMPMEGRSERGEGGARGDELAAVAAELAARAKAAPQTVPARTPVSAAPRETSPASPPSKSSRWWRTLRAKILSRDGASPEHAPPRQTSEEGTPKGSAPKERAANEAIEDDAVIRDRPRAVPPKATPNAAAPNTVEHASPSAEHNARVVRVAITQLDRPRLVSAAADGPAWTVAIGEVIEQTRAAAISRNIIGAARSNVVISFEEARKLHYLRDAEAGDALMVVTALGPPRGLVKAQDFVEFRALVSTHGVVLQPLADDLFAEFAPDKIVISRPSGLILSPVTEGGGRSGAAVYQPHVLDARVWKSDRQADFRERNAQLIRAAAEATEAKRPIARANLARFYLARDMGVEAKGVLERGIVRQPADR
jgi:hypothetical protein